MCSLTAGSTATDYSLKKLKKCATKKSSEKDGENRVLSVAALAAENKLQSDRITVNVAVLIFKNKAAGAAFFIN